MRKVTRLEDSRYLDFSGIRNADMAIRELREAKRCREDRESKFDISLISGIEIDEYVKSVAKEINLQTKATTYVAFEIGKLLWDVKNLLPHGKFLKWTVTLLQSKISLTGGRNVNKEKYTYIY